MQEALAHWTASAAGYAVLGLLGRQRCECHCYGSVDQALLAIVEKQLDRCGLEQLNVRPCPAVAEPPPSAGPLFWLVACFL